MEKIKTNKIKLFFPFWIYVKKTIVGNKCELSTKRVVNEETKITFEKRLNIKIIEASSKNNINVNESFLLLVDKMIELGRGKYKNNNCDDEDEEDYKKYNHRSKLIKLDKYFNY